MNRNVVLTLVLVTAGLAGCAGTSNDATSEANEHTETIRVPAGQGLEWKLAMDEGDAMRYAWTASTSLNFDFHGEPEGGAPGEFTSHKLGDSDTDGGDFTAPFTGTHGWYWENQGDTDATVQLAVEGTFEVVGFV